MTTMAILGVVFLVNVLVLVLRLKLAVRRRLAYQEFRNVVQFWDGAFIERVKFFKSGKKETNQNSLMQTFNFITTHIDFENII